MEVQLCRECSYIYHSDSRILCPVCNSLCLTLPCSENLVGICTLLIDRHIEVVRATCDVHDVLKGCIGTTVQIQIELGRLYPSEMWCYLPPDWWAYTYHTIVDNNNIGAAYTGLCHLDSFLESDDDECEFATSLTISNLELWLTYKDEAAFWSVWKLFGALD
jgi:hypothetical protein